MQNEEDRSTQGLSNTQRYRPLLQGFVITVIAVIASATLGGSALGRFISSGTIDLLIRRAPLHKQAGLILIDITEDDYKNLFGRVRPLNPSIILTMVRAAISGGATLVAIDIATEDWPIDSGIDRALASIGGPSAQHAAVVWARNFSLQEARNKASYVMEPLLGGSPVAGRECYGIPAFAEEAGVVRWFSTGLKINSVYEPSFVHQILYRSKNESCLEGVQGDGLRLISFSASIPTESASTLMLESKDKEWGHDVRPYLGAIVIIGGSFHEGGDIRRTPIGPRSGLQITGQAVASSVNGQARSEVGEVWSVTIDSAIGFAIVLLGLSDYRLQYWATAVAFLLAIVGMWILWREYYLFLSFVPILIGLIAHLILERHFHQKTPASFHSRRHRIATQALVGTRESDSLAHNKEGNSASPK